MESSDPRWSTRRAAAPLPTYEEAPPAPVVTYAPAPVVVYAPVYARPWGYYGYGPRFYPRPFIGVRFGGGFHGGFRGGGFHGGGGFRGGGGFHGGRAGHR